MAYFASIYNTAADLKVANGVNIKSAVSKLPSKLHKNENNSDISLFTNPSTRAGYDTRSIFKGSLTSLNSVFLILD